MLPLLGRLWEWILRQWALAVQHRFNHNKAACALANKLARICYATLRDQQPYGSAPLTQKTQRTACALPMPHRGFLSP